MLLLTYFFGTLLPHSIPSGLLISKKFIVTKFGICTDISNIGVSALSRILYVVPNQTQRCPGQQWTNLNAVLDSAEGLETAKVFLLWLVLFIFHTSENSIFKHRFDSINSVWKILGLTEFHLIRNYITICMCKFLNLAESIFSGY